MSGIAGPVIREIGNNSNNKEKKIISFWSELSVIILIRGFSVIFFKINKQLYQQWLYDNKKKAQNFNSAL